MALPPLVRQLIEVKLMKYCERKIPPHVRDKIKLLYKIRGNSVTLIETRPYFRDPNEWTESVVAQFRYDPKSMTWTLYCADRNSRWHFYDLVEPTPDLDEIIAAVDDDPTGIFWG